MHQQFWNIANVDGRYVAAYCKQALPNTKNDHWQAAIDTEYYSLQKRLVVKPADCKIVDFKLVFKIMRNSDGIIAKYKARIVVGSSIQEYCIDYTETLVQLWFSLSSIEILLALAAYNDWEEEQLDVVTAFLSAELKKKLYMRQQERFWQSVDDGSESVYDLHQSIYGLNQSPRYWY